MKITTACLFLVATLGVHNTNTVNAGPLVKRSCYNGGNAVMTNYWIPLQGSKDENNNGNKMKLSGPNDSAIKTPDGKTIAMVDDNTWKKCSMEGTCVIRAKGKDTLVNLANDGGKNSKFDIINRNRPFGEGSKDNPLCPFASVAVNDLGIGTTLFVKELKGFKLPNGMVHNGCVRVDDEGWSFGNCQLDFFVLSYENYDAMNTPSHVSVSKKKCKILDYSTKKDYAFVGAKAPQGTPGKGVANPQDDKGNNDGGGKADDSKGNKTDGSTSKSSESCDSASTFIKAYSDTSFGGSETCLTGSSCHDLSGVTKSSKWGGGKITFYKSGGCSGETLYTDGNGEDEDMSGDGSGFNAGSVQVE